MNEESGKNYCYQVGGALDNQEQSYVIRESDCLFYEALKAGEFCYVLNSRQTGKSSLMVRALAKLQADGWAGIVLDFSAKDSQINQPERWYNGIINQLNRHWQLLDNARSWIKERNFISPVERLAEFIETVLLPGISNPIVIFIDEIDSTINIPFTDDFFALIRSCYNKRAENPDYKGLTFALLGVATPAELISDKKRTPFNIGKAIDLKGFQLKEVSPLSRGLAGKVEDTQAVLQEILKRTGGQPFLTQRLCQLVVDASFSIPAGKERETIGNLTHSRLIYNWESQDEQNHLKTIKDRLLSNERKAGNLLELYRQIRQEGEIPAQNSSEERDLQLSGLVVKREGKLQVYNPIYQEVFNESWIDGELRNLHPYAESFRAWVASGKTEPSWLLRGKALEEAEAWAKDKNLSGEDRDFLSASRTQQREAEIAQKEKEVMLERERQAREAAEEAERIQVEANRQAQRRILLGSIVLVVTLLGGLISFGWSYLEARNAAKARIDREKVTQEANRQRILVKNAQEELQKQTQNLQILRVQKHSVEKKYQEIVNKLNEALEKQKNAEETAKLAEEAIRTVQAEKEQVQNELAQANKKLAGAKEAVKRAEEAVKIAEAKQKQAEAQIEAAIRQQKEIQANIEVAQELLQLAGQLQNQGKYVPYNDALAQAGISFKYKNSQLTQALLWSSISLAYQHLEQWDKAEEALQKSRNLVESNESLFTEPEGLPIAFFTYSVQGNLQEETKKSSPQSAYQKAVKYLEKSQFNDLAPEVSERVARGEIIFAYDSLNDSLSDSNQEDFRNLVQASLKKQYSFRTKQLIQELEELLKQKDWKEADSITQSAIASSSYSKNSEIFLYSNVSCTDLRKIDELWYDNSDEKFGFRVQMKIYRETGNPIGDYDPNAYRRFGDSMGWREGGEWKNYGELNWGENSPKISPKGHLPIGGIWGDGWFFERLVEEIVLFSRCNL